MAKRSDLIGLGVPYAVANIQANEPALVTVQGTSIGSAFVIGGQQYLNVVNATNAGQFVQLPTVGGFTGCLLGDDFLINNQLAATIVVCAPSAATISVSGNNVSGGAGFSMSAHTTTAFYAITATSWLGLKGS